MLTPYGLDEKCCTAALKKGMVEISGPCVVTGATFTVTVKMADWLKYKAGGYVQDCFPYLKADQREFLISGISPAGWDEAFAGPEICDDDEEDEDE